MKAKLQAIKTDNSKPLDSLSMEEIIGRPVTPPSNLKPPVFKEALVSFDMGNKLNSVLNELSVEDEQRRIV